MFDEEGNNTQQTEIVVEPMEEFEEKSHLLIARSLSDMVDDAVWVRVLNPTLEEKKVYKNCKKTENIAKNKKTLQKAENVYKICRKNLKSFYEHIKITLTIIQNIELNLILRCM